MWRTWGADIVQMLYYLLPPLIPPGVMGVIPQTEAICPWPARYKLIARLFRSNCNPENKMHLFPQDVRLLKSWVGGSPSNIPPRSHKCRRRGWRFAMQMRVWFDKQTCKVAFTEPTWVHHGNQPLGPLSLPTGTATFRLDWFSTPPTASPLPISPTSLWGIAKQNSFCTKCGGNEAPTSTARFWIIYHSGHTVLCALPHQDVCSAPLKETMPKKKNWKRRPIADTHPSC